MVTKQDVARQFNVSLNNVTQIDSKQLFIVNDYSSLDSNHSNRRYLVSYMTIIGVYEFNHCTWHITKEKFSPTTSKQTTCFIKSIITPVLRVEKEEFKKLVS